MYNMICVKIYLCIKNIGNIYNLNVLYWLYLSNKIIGDLIFSCVCVFQFFLQ